MCAPLSHPRFQSVDDEDPSKGALAAAAVKMLATYVTNHVNKNVGTIQLEPPSQLYLPPLRVYQHVQVTGRVICRLLGDDPAATSATTTPGASSATTTPSKKSQTSQSSAEPPELPDPEGAIRRGNKRKSTAGEEEEPEEDSENEDPEEESENDDGGDLEAMNKLEEQLKAKKGAKGKAKSKAKTKSKASKKN